MDDLIYIQIAAYRDPELLPTIRDCIKRADQPQNLRFGILWQTDEADEWDTLEEFNLDFRFKIHAIAAKESRGACWARHKLNEMYDGEKYTLQLDSHHRFVKGWDTKCKAMYGDLIAAGVPKPLITAYLPSYDPQDDPGKRVREVWKLDFDRFTPEGIVFMLPAILPDADKYPLPIPTRFFSAHFVFTAGQFIKDVPYDPNLYFHGEEISMAVRAYTHGYDLFTPNIQIAWHEYTRKGRVRHWDENQVWVDLNNKSLKRVKELLGVDGDIRRQDFTGYDLGTERTLTDYQEYAGIRFRNRAVQQYTRDNHNAPNPRYSTEEAYEASFNSIFRHCLDIHKSSLHPVCSDYDFWAIAFQNEFETEIYREDAYPEEIKTLMDTDSEWINLWRQFPYEKVPQKAVIWPHSETLGWLDRFEITIPRL